MKTTVTKAAGAALLSCALLAAAPGAARASVGMRTKFAEVTVNNLKIGQSFSLADTVNFPLRVFNQGDEALDLSVSVVAPGSGEEKAGFENIPDVSWIRLQRSTFTVPPGMDGVTDVIITVPDDEKLLGRRFCVYLWTQSLGATAYGVGLKSRLLISVSSQKPSADDLKKKFVPKRLANLNFNFVPMATEITVPVGRRIELEDLHADLKLVNSDEESFDFRFTPVSMWETSITPPPGYEAAPDPKWLIVPQPVFKAKGESFNPLHLAVEIPDQDNNRNRAFMLILRGEILEQDIPAYGYAKIFVRTQK